MSAQWSHQVGAVPCAVKGAVRWALGVLVHHPAGHGSFWDQDEDGEIWRLVGDMTFIFPYIGYYNHPNWLIFFKGVQTTNQKNIDHIHDTDRLMMVYRSKLLVPSSCNTFWYARMDGSSLRSPMCRMLDVFLWIKHICLCESTTVGWGLRCKNCKVFSSPTWKWVVNERFHPKRWWLRQTTKYSFWMSLVRPPTRIFLGNGMVLLIFIYTHGPEIFKACLFFQSFGRHLGLGLCWVAIPLDSWC